MAKRLIKKCYFKFRHISPTLFYLIEYKLASRRVLASFTPETLKHTRNQLFNDFLGRNNDKGACLQIGVKDVIGKKFGSNWVSVDKYDKRDFIDYNYDIHDLQFEDEHFDAVVCWSILEHVPFPQKAISELYRVLKPGGEIWVQLPFLYPYHEGPKDYWRVTPDGLRVWMKDFNEVNCGCDYWNKTPLVTATYFNGKK